MSSKLDDRVYEGSPLYPAFSTAVDRALVLAERAGVDTCWHLERAARWTMALYQAGDRPPFLGCAECTALERVSRVSSDTDGWTCDTCGEVTAPCEVRERGKPRWANGDKCQSCREDGSLFTLTPVAAQVGPLLVIARVCHSCWKHRRQR